MLRNLIFKSHKLLYVRRPNSTLFILCRNDGIIAECFFLSLGRDPKLPEIILNLTQCESRIRLIVKRFRAAQSRCHFFQASFCSRSEHDTDKQTHWRR